MFKLTVTEDEIQATLKQLEKIIYPDSVSLMFIAFFVFDYADTADDNLGIDEVTEIDMRKIRLCINELRSRGYLIIAKRGYSFAGVDPEPAIHFLNGLYSRAYELTKEADIMYRGIKQKYGDEVAAKVQQMPEQPALGGVFNPSVGYLVGQENANDASPSPARTLISRNEVCAEPPYQKSYSKDGTMHNV